MTTKQPNLTELLADIDPATLTSEDCDALIGLLGRRMDWAQAQRADPANAGEALTEALVLSVTASTDEQAREALALADQIAAGLTEIDVARAKQRAEALLGTS